MNIQAPRGTYDVLPDQSAKWQEVEQKLMTCADFTNTKKFAHQFSNTRNYSNAV
ncbi:hypothetical protein B481_3183 [Planococcus halocryophilus Or1]|nr:hypothetical protein B481_3183 [Planococcus halocryophilus Or1]